MAEIFFEGLSEKGPVSSQIMTEFSICLEGGKIKILPNSGVAISTVSRASNGDAMIFLPFEYNKKDAVVEAPRLVLGALRIIRSPIADIDCIEDRFREELHKLEASA